MALVKHVTCADDASFETPVVGPAWTKSGTPTYDGTFGGLNLSSSSGWFTTFDQSPASIGFTFKAGFGSGDNTKHDILYDKQQGGYLSIHKETDNKIHVMIWDYGATNSQYLDSAFNLDGWESGDEIEIGIALDNGQSGDLKMRLFINGVEQEFSSSSGGGGFNGSGIGITTGGYTNVSGAIKDLKFWDEYKTDWGGTPPVEDDPSQFIN